MGYLINYEQNYEKTKWEAYTAAHVECINCPAYDYCELKKDDVYWKRWSCGETIWRWLKQEVNYD